MRSYDYTGEAADYNELNLKLFRYIYMNYCQIGSDLKNTSLLLGQIIHLVMN